MSKKLELPSLELEECNLTMARALCKANRDDEALKYFKALCYKPTVELEILDEYAEALMENKDFHLAIKQWLLVEGRARERNDKKNLITALEGLTRAYFRVQKNQDARKCREEVENIRRKADEGDDYESDKELSYSGEEDAEFNQSEVEDDDEAPIPRHAPIIQKFQPQSDRPSKQLVKPKKIPFVSSKVPPRRTKLSDKFLVP